MRLIDADALKADCDIYNSWDAQIVKAWLDDQPTIEERKTGRWIYDNEAYPYGNPCGHYDCDQCGESVPHKTNFCPNCGCKMEVENEC